MGMIQSHVSREYLIEMVEAIDAWLETTSLTEFEIKWTGRKLTIEGEEI